MHCVYASGGLSKKNCDKLQLNDITVEWWYLIIIKCVHVFREDDVQTSRH